ncbi:hypothetical protein ACFL0G_04050 [Candidatus Zixiibacteriota bacterium]
MRSRELVLLVALTALIYSLFPAATAIAEKSIIELDGRAHVLEISKSVPNELNYQGYLADAADSSAITATLEMTFRLFDSETKGVELWTETHPAVEVQGGLFQALLGSVTPFPDGLFDSSEMWLQTEVGTEVLSPRKPMVSVAYSHRTNSAEMLLDNTLTDLDDRWVNEADLDHLDAADGDPASAVHVDDAGKVGIGTSTPLTELDVNGSVNATTYYGDGSNLTGISGTADDDWTISGDTVYHDTGPVGIGTSDPEMLLDVYGGTARLTWGLIVGKTSTGVPGIHIYDDDVGPSIRFTNASGFDSRSSISFMDTTGALWTIDNDIYGDHGQNFGVKDDRALEYRVFIDSAGKVGIGTISPSRTLDVAGDVNAATYYGDGSNLTGISSSTDNDWTIAGSNVYHEVGNVGIGTNAPQRQLHIKGANPRILIEASSSSPEVNFMNTGDAGTDIWSVYKHGTTDDLRFYQGGDKMTLQNSTGNVGIGTTSPGSKLDVSGDVNTDSLYKIDGSSVLSVSSIKRNTLVGIDAGANNTENYGTFVGYNAGYNNEGTTCTFVGTEAGYSNQGEGNTFVGAAAGENKTSGVYNTVIGAYAGFGQTPSTGHYNTILGAQAGLNIASGNSNTYIGTYAGVYNDLGSNNVFLGYKAGFDETGSNKLYIANGEDTSDVLIYGDFSTGRVGIGTLNPLTDLSVVRDASNYAYLTSTSSGIEARSDWIGGHFTGGGSDGVRAFSSSLAPGDGAVYASNSAGGNAGYFAGNLHFTGTMTGGTKSFLIDHPLDPLNKTLLHYCIESPEPLLVYKGKIEVDGHGEAVVQMPEYFAALTKEQEACINLTPVGKPFLTGVQWNSDYASFTVYGEPDREVYYTVYADRDDPVMRQLHRPVEQEKGDGYFERGKLLYPEAYGYPKSMDVAYEKNQIVQD